jgi:hypothetical protein
MLQKEQKKSGWCSFNLELRGGILEDNNGIMQGEGGQ